MYLLLNCIYVFVICLKDVSFLIYMYLISVFYLLRFFIIVSYFIYMYYCFEKKVLFIISKYMFNIIINV